LAVRQLSTATDAHHLSAAVLAEPFFARNVREITWRPRIGDIDDRRPVELRYPGDRVDRLRRLIGSAVMADIENPPAVLIADNRLIRAARLQVVMADQLNVARFAGELLAGCRCGCNDRRHADDDNGSSCARVHRDPPCVTNHKEILALRVWDPSKR